MKVETQTWLRGEQTPRWNLQQNFTRVSVQAQGVPGHRDILSYFMLILTSRCPEHGIKELGPCLRYFQVGLIRMHTMSQKNPPNSVLGINPKARAGVPSVPITCRAEQTPRRRSCRRLRVPPQSATGKIAPFGDPLRFVRPDEPTTFIPRPRILRHPSQRTEETRVSTHPAQCVCNGIMHRSAYKLAMTPLLPSFGGELASPGICFPRRRNARQHPRRGAVVSPGHTQRRKNPERDPLRKRHAGRPLQDRHQGHKSKARVFALNTDSRRRVRGENPCPSFLGNGNLPRDP